MLHRNLFNQTTATSRWELVVSGVTIKKCDIVCNYDIYIYTYVNSHGLFLKYFTEDLFESPFSKVVVFLSV